MMSQDASDEVEVPEAPSIHGLKFRHFRGEADYAAIVAVNRETNIEYQTYLKGH